MKFGCLHNVSREHILDNLGMYIGPQVYKAKDGFELKAGQTGTIMSFKNEYLIFRPLNKWCQFALLKHELKTEVED